MRETKVSGIIIQTFLLNYLAFSLAHLKSLPIFPFIKTQLANLVMQEKLLKLLLILEMLLKHLTIKEKLLKHLTTLEIIPRRNS